MKLYDREAFAKTTAFLEYKFNQLMRLQAPESELLILFERSYDLYRYYKLENEAMEFKIQTRSKK